MVQQPPACSGETCWRCVIGNIFLKTPTWLWDWERKVVVCLQPHGKEVRLHVSVYLTTSDSLLGALSCINPEYTPTLSPVICVYIPLHAYSVIKQNCHILHDYVVYLATEISFPTHLLYLEQLQWLRQP